MCFHVCECACARVHNGTVGRADSQFMCTAELVDFLMQCTWIAASIVRHGDRYAVGALIFYDSHKMMTAIMLHLGRMRMLPPNCGQFRRNEFE